MSSINLKPNKPECYDGKRDFLTVNTWIYTIGQYLSLTQLSSPSIQITEHNRIAFASSYLKGNAAVRWYNLVNSPSVPTSWNKFKEFLILEFIPADHTPRARDKLRKLKQTTSVEHYLAEFRNIVLMIGDISEGEKIDRFVEGLKYNVKIEVMKSSVNSFEESARIALNIDSAIWRARRSTSGFHPHTPNVGGPTPMEIGNVNGASTRAHREQRKKDLDKGACFACHKVGCRPWKCRPSRVNNSEIIPGNSVSEGSEVILSDSENE